MYWLKRSLGLCGAVMPVRGAQRIVRLVRLVFFVMILASYGISMHKAAKTYHCSSRKTKFNIPDLV